MQKCETFYQLKLICLGYVLFLTIIQDLQKQKTKLEEKLLEHQGELNQKKSRADVAKAELDLANSSYQKEKEVFDKMMKTYEDSAKGIENNKK